jgi:hypothetical protein
LRIWPPRRRQHISANNIDGGADGSRTGTVNRQSCEGIRLGKNSLAGGGDRGDQQRERRAPGAHPHTTPWENGKISRRRLKPRLQGGRDRRTAEKRRCAGWPVDQQLDVIGDGMQYRDYGCVKWRRGLHRRCTGTGRRIRDDENGAKRPDLRVTLFENAAVVGGMMRVVMRVGMTMDDGPLVSVASAFMHVHRAGEWNPRQSRAQRKPGNPRQGHDGRHPKRSKDLPQLKSI